MPLEIACFTLFSAKTALSCGVDRVELCSGLEAGGVTPTIQDFKDLLSFRDVHSDTRSIPINIMIRPRGGDFVYSEHDFSTMKSSLLEFAALGADGFVFGILTPGGVVDERRNAELVSLAGGRPCTFHRAFDEIVDKDAALEAVIRCGFKAVLTSGGAVDVVAGKTVLKNLVEQASGRIEVMPGGGLRSTNLKALKSYAGARWWHSSAIIAADDADDSEIKALKAILNS